jgi:hypothetical protein
MFKKFLILATLTVLVPPEPPMILNGEKLKTSEDTEIRLAFFSRNSVIIVHILSMHQKSYRRKSGGGNI